MATLRLELDLDSDVYPELHEALSALRSARARGERLRQLASAGLVWENVRMYGAAAIGPTAPDRAVVPAPLVKAVAPPSRAERPAAPERRATPRPKPPPKLPDPRGADFVDLAISAEPESPPPPGRRARSPAEDHPVRNLPVLRDVVNEPDDGQQVALPVMTEVVDVRAADDDPPAAVSQALPDDAVHLASLAEKPATRSRLMRMKERGLFKNG